MSDGSWLQCLSSPPANSPLNVLTFECLNKGFYEYEIKDRSALLLRAEIIVFLKDKSTKEREIEQTDSE